MFLRKIIILNKQGSKDFKGHVKLEVRGIKGKLSLSLEGEQVKEEATYKLYILSNEQKEFKEILLSDIDINKSGRGKLDLSFNSSSVGQSKISIADFNTILIKEENSEKSDVDIILAGYIHKDDDSISKIISINEHRKTLKAKSQTIDKVLDEKVEEIQKVDQIINEENKNLQDNEKDKISEPINEAKNDIKNLEQVKESENEIKKVKDETKNKSSVKQKSENSETSMQENSSNNYSEQIINYTLDILKIFKEIKPFKIEDDTYRWWQIDYDNMNNHRGFLPYYSYILDPPASHSNKSRYTSCQKQIQKYNRYLFGVAENKGKITHYIYGIPGRYEKSEHPYGGSTGFVTWLEDKSRTGSGYWLSYIDAYTGNVVRPL